MKSFDIVFEDLFKNKDFENIEKIFLDLGYIDVFVIKVIENTKELNSIFTLPISKKLNFHKLYMFKNLKDLSKYNCLEKSIAYGGSVKQNNLVVNNNKLNIILNPISKTLSFDEQTANLCKLNNKVVAFDHNLLRDRYFVNNLKQIQFIINLLLLKKVDFIFCSFAKDINDLVDIKILKALLLNLNLEESLINRLVSKSIILEK